MSPKVATGVDSNRDAPELPFRGLRGDCSNLRRQLAQGLVYLGPSCFGEATFGYKEGMTKGWPWSYARATIDPSRRA